MFVLRESNLQDELGSNYFGTLFKVSRASSRGLNDLKACF
jgi:hypothetical protein